MANTCKFGVAFEGYYQYNWNRPYDRDQPAARLRHARQRRSAFSRPRSSSRARRTSTPAAASARASTCSSARPRRRCRAAPANEPRPDVYRHVWQAYGTYVFPVGRGLQADFGKFASNLGYETNYAKDNNHFSRAYLFNFLPFYHSGLRVSLPVSDKVTVMYMLTNGIQQTEDFNDFKSNHFTAIVKPIGSDRPGRPTTTSARSSPTAASPMGPTASSRCSTPTSTYTADADAELRPRRQLRRPTR